MNWDPEGLMPTREEGLIDRRMRERAAKQDEKYVETMKEQAAKLAKQDKKRRESRTPPTTSFGMIDFLLETPAEDVEFEIARNRPLLREDFFELLEREIQACKFGITAEADKDRLAELELLNTYVVMTVGALDAAVTQLSSPKERMAKLLTAKDKKAMLLEMAGANELDAGLIDLLDQNVLAAREAGQEQAADFMEKVRKAANRYVIRTADADTIKKEYEEETKMMEEMLEKAADMIEEQDSAEIQAKLLGTNGIVDITPGTQGSTKTSPSGLILPNK